MKTKALKGKVVSTKMKNTCVVEVGTAKKHSKYSKRYVSHKRFKADCANIDVKDGDMVSIKLVAPISKTKSFIVTEIIS